MADFIIPANITTFTDLQKAVESVFYTFVIGLVLGFLSLVQQQANAYFKSRQADRHHDEVVTLSRTNSATSNNSPAG